MHRRSSVLCTAVYLQGGFAAQEQPINSLAWKEPFHQLFLTRCSCHFVSTPACKFGLDWYKTWAVAATSERIHLLAGNCQHHTHYSVSGKRLPDGTYISSLTAEYPSLMASAIVDIIRPWVSQNFHCYNPILQWKTLLAKQPISRGPRITDGAGDISSANWAIPFCQDIFKAVRQKWCTRILSKHLHAHVTQSSQKHTTDPFISEEELIPFLQDLQDCFPSETQDVSIPPFQPFRLQLFRKLLVLSQDPDHHIAELLQVGIPSGAFTPLAPTNLWEKNTTLLGDTPDLHICQDNWMSANQNPLVTTNLIQAELEAGFIEEIPDLPTAEKRWPRGIALGKLGVAYTENRDPRLVLDSTICGINGRLRHISLFLSSCPAMQDQWQGASIDVKAAHKRMRIREEERGSLLFRFQNRLYAYRTAHFGAKTSTWHWGRVSGAILRLLHKFLFFRHAAWVYIDDFFFLFPESTAQLQYTLAIVLLRVLGTPLSWKKLEFEDTIEWNGWTIQPNMMLAHLPSVKQEKIIKLILSLREHPSKKGLEKIIGIILWVTSMVHHTRFLLTSLYRDLYSIPATNYNIEPTRWQEFLSFLNEDAIISQKNKLHLPVGAHMVDFRHQTITSKSQLPQDVSIERHAWVRLRDPLIDKRKLSTESQDTLSWVQHSLLPMLRSIPLNRCSHLTIEAAADAFAHADSMGIGGWINIGYTRYWFSQLWKKTRFGVLPTNPQRTPKVHRILGSTGTIIYYPFSEQEMRMSFRPYIHPIRIR